MSLIFSMVLRFVPKFANQFRLVSDAQRTLGRDVGESGIFPRLKQGIKETSIMVTWSLENSLDTADSMKARGYGLPGRTAFSIFRFDNRDKLLLIALGAILLILIIGVAFGQHRVQYFPIVLFPDLTLFSYILYGVYTLLCLLPIILNGMEDVKWKHLQSKI
jgi:energy-coupling factor transport system permease protein